MFNDPADDLQWPPPTTTSKRQLYAPGVEYRLWNFIFYAAINLPRSLLSFGGLSSFNLYVTTALMP